MTPPQWVLAGAAGATPASECPPPQSFTSIFHGREEAHGYFGVWDPFPIAGTGGDRI